MSLTARLVLPLRQPRKPKVGTELDGPLWKKKRKRHPARRSVYGLRSFSLSSPFGSLPFCSSRRGPLHRRPAVDHFHLDAQPSRVDLTHVRLTIGGALGVEIAQDRSSASLAPRHRALNAVAARQNFDLPRLAHHYFSLRRGSSEATHRCHGLARWASHSFWVGKLLTIFHPRRAAAVSLWTACVLRCGNGGCIRYQPTKTSAATWRGHMPAHLAERARKPKGRRPGPLRSTPRRS